MGYEKPEFTVTQELVDRGVFVGAVRKYPEAASHALRPPRPLSPGTPPYGACGLSMSNLTTPADRGEVEPRFTLALPAVITCLNCLHAIRSHLPVWEERAAGPVAPPEPAYAEGDVVPSWGERPLSASEAEDLNRTGWRPLPAATAAGAQLSLIDGPAEGTRERSPLDTGISDIEVIPPPAASTLVVTQDMVSQGIFTGVATVRSESGSKSHSASVDYRDGQATHCGSSLRDGRPGSGHVVTWQELPAAVTCGTCLPRARALLAEPKDQGEAIASVLGKLSDAIGQRDLAQDQVLELNREVEALRSALNEGVENWRARQRDIQLANARLQKSERKLLAEISVLEARAGVSPPPAAGALSGELRARAQAVRWRGLCGVLAWKHGGPGVAEKVISLTAMEWAAGYGALFEVTGEPVVDGDGRFEIKVAIRKPGDLGVFSENDGGREAAGTD